MMRWADMDMLGHVNNVAYIDYLQEARVDLFAAHDAFRGRQSRTEGVVVVDYQVDFLAPLVFRRRPVLVDVWVSRIRAASFTLGYEIYDLVDGERLVYLRASSLMAPFVFETEAPRRITADERELLRGYFEETPARASLPGELGAVTVTPIRLRFTDLDVFQHANNVRYFEFFQESRIEFLTRLYGNESGGDQVAARIDIGYRKPMHYRRAPYEIHNWVSHVGGRSFVIASKICDGEDVLATCRVVLVPFDKEAQRSVPILEEHRSMLLAARATV